MTAKRNHPSSSAPRVGLGQTSANYQAPAVRRFLLIGGTRPLAAFRPPQLHAGKQTLKAHARWQPCASTSATGSLPTCPGGRHGAATSQTSATPGPCSSSSGSGSEEGARFTPCGPSGDSALARLRQARDDCAMEERE